MVDCMVACMVDCMVELYCYVNDNSNACVAIYEDMNIYSYIIEKYVKRVGEQ